MKIGFNVFIFFALFMASKINAQDRTCGYEYLLNIYNSYGFDLNQALQNSDEATKNNVHIIKTFYRSTIVIPVVFQIIWGGEDEFITEQEIKSQLAALNNDFNANNFDVGYVPHEFEALVGSSNITFCLADIDPYGNATTGINYKATNINEIGLSENLFYDSLGGITAWDAEKYLNIWVANTGHLISGLGSIPGLSDPAKTGVVIHPHYFGNGKFENFAKGRTLVHEIGHFLGLKHLWGDNSICIEDDGISDTPPQKQAYSGCPVYPQSGCSESEMFMNFMDYVYDHCMFLFTEGQVEWMQATLYTHRSGLINNGLSACKELEKSNLEHSIGFPNPVIDLYTIHFNKPINKLISVEVFSNLGASVMFKNVFVYDELLLDLSHLPTGIYFIDAQNSVFKVIKVR